MSSFEDRLDGLRHQLLEFIARYPGTEDARRARETLVRTREPGYSRFTLWVDEATLRISEGTMRIMSGMAEGKVALALTSLSVFGTVPWADGQALVGDDWTMAESGSDVSDLSGASSGQWSTVRLEPDEPVKLRIEGGKGLRLVATNQRVLLLHAPPASGEPYITEGSAPYHDIVDIELSHPAQRQRGWLRVASARRDLGMPLPVNLTYDPDEAARALVSLVNARSRAMREMWPEMDEAFECQKCGRLARMAAAMRVRAEILDTMDARPEEWDAIEHAADLDPIRPAWLQRTFGWDFERAKKFLDSGVQRQVLTERNKGYTVRQVLCDSCLSEAQPQRREGLRDPVPPQLRFRVLQRDAFRCRYCGKSAREGAVLHVDHVIPVYAGGETTEDNLITACDECNLGKSTRDVLG